MIDHPLVLRKTGDDLGNQCVPAADLNRSEPGPIPIGDKDRPLIGMPEEHAPSRALYRRAADANKPEAALEKCAASPVS